MRSSDRAAAWYKRGDGRIGNSPRTVREAQRSRQEPLSRTQGGRRASGSQARSEGRPEAETSVARTCVRSAMSGLWPMRHRFSMYTDVFGVLWTSMPLLGQAEADALFAMPKRSVDSTPYDFPHMGQSLAIPIVSVDGTEQFVLYVQRKGVIRPTKIALVKRARNSIGLARLDVDGTPHRNPDQAEIPCPHLHYYREGFDLRWAMPAPPASFTNTADLYVTCHEFMTYCNVTSLPVINLRLIV